MNDNQDKPLNQIQLEQISDLFDAGFARVDSKIEARFADQDSKLTIQESKLEQRTSSEYLCDALRPLFQENLRAQFGYVDKALANAQKELEGIKKQYERILSNLDKYHSENEEYRLEVVAMGAQVNRLQSYINHIAEKTGVNLISLGV